MPENSTKFFDLPREIRNQIYESYVLSSASALGLWRTNRKLNVISKQFGKEAIATFFFMAWFTISFTLSKITCQDGIFPVGRDCCQFISRIRYMTFKLSLRQPYPDLKRAHLKIEKHVHSIIMALVNSGRVLQGFNIEIEENLNLAEVIEILDGFRDLRVRKWVKITGLYAKGDLRIQELKGVMISPEHVASADGGKELLWSKKTEIGMCIDIWKYIETCKGVISHWPESHNTDRKHMLNKLDHLFILLPGLDDSGNLLHQFPAGTDPDEEFRKAILRVEEFNKCICRLRYRRYPYKNEFRKGRRPDNLDEARDRLYKRRTFCEIKVGAHFDNGRMIFKSFDG